MLTRLAFPRVPAAVLLAAGVWLCAGCGDGRRAVYPVRGKVLTANQKPATGAMVTFHPVTPDPKDAARPVGKVDEQGEYRLTTYTENDGAPAGAYTVTIIWPTPKKAPFEPDGPDKLGGKFARPESSPHKVTVEAKPDKEVPTISLP
jgi:hypothetical protein